jgi:2,3-bisphosphoglycerate-dependent phosphoglycerate mutase
MQRAMQTLQYILHESTMKKTPIVYHDDPQLRDWEHHSGDTTTELPVYLNPALAERYYGELQGLDKDETRKKYGEEQVHIWRRSFSIAPPGGESLQDTAHRTLPYFIERIQPELEKDKTVLVSAHGNSLRAIVMHLEQISEDNIPNVEIPTGKPLQYDLDESMHILQKITQ